MRGGVVGGSSSAAVTKPLFELDARAPLLEVWLHEKAPLSVAEALRLGPEVAVALQVAEHPVATVVAQALGAIVAVATLVVIVEAVTVVAILAEIQVTAQALLVKILPM